MRRSTLAVLVLLAASCGGSSGDVSGRSSETTMSAVVTSPSVSTTEAPTTTVTVQPVVTTTTARAASSGATASSDRVSSLASYALDFDRLGPIVIGMTVTEAQQAAGVQLLENREGGSGDCATLTPGDGTGVTMYVVGGRIVMISGTAVRTAEGFGRGTSASRITAAVPASRIVDRPDRVAVRAIEVSPADTARSGFRLVFGFASSDGTATSLRAGLLPDVVLRDEGCA